jgi:hypothetical protein
VTRGSIAAAFVAGLILGADCGPNRTEAAQLGVHDEAMEVLAQVVQLEARLREHELTISRLVSEVEKQQRRARR